MSLRVFVLAAAALFFDPSIALSANAVKSPTDYSIWENTGLGLSASSDDSGLAAILQAHALVNRKHLFTLRYVVANASTFLHGYPHEAAALYGRATTTPYGILYASVGLAGVSTSNSQYEEVATIGVPVEAGAIYTPFPFLGLGAEFVGDANPVESFGAVMLTVHLGAVRPGTLRF